MSAFIARHHFECSSIAVTFFFLPFNEKKKEDATVVQESVPKECKQKQNQDQRLN